MAYPIRHPSPRQHSQHSAPCPGVVLLSALPFMFFFRWFCRQQLLSVFLGMSLFCLHFWRSILCNAQFLILIWCFSDGIPCSLAFLVADGQSAVCPSPERCGILFSLLVSGFSFACTSRYSIDACIRIFLCLCYCISLSFLDSLICFHPVWRMSVLVLLLQCCRWNPGSHSCTHARRTLSHWAHSSSFFFLSLFCV